MDSLFGRIGIMLVMMANVGPTNRPAQANNAAIPKIAKVINRKSINGVFHILNKPYLTFV
jgi:hypothetical protein